MTGWQGAAAARHLQRAGHRVIGITHTPSKAPKLELAGIEALVADLRDPATLEPRLKGVDGFFIVTDPFAEQLETDEWDSPAWAEGEIRQGRGAIRAAHASKVPHVVLASVSIWAQEKGFRFHKGKALIEREARELGLACTILRPPAFMEGWIWTSHKRGKPLEDWVRTGRIEWPFKSDTPIPHIATDDIGRVTAWSFAHPDRSIDQDWELVGEVTTFPTIAQTLSKRVGRPVVFAESPLAEAGIPFFKSLIEREYRWDPSLWEAKFDFQMTTFEGFMNRLSIEL